MMNKILSWRTIIIFGSSVLLVLLLIVNCSTCLYLKQEEGAISLAPSSNKISTAGFNFSENYKFQNPTLSFRYKKSWGTPSMLGRQEGLQGELFQIAFRSSDENRKELPDIWLETNNYDPGGHDFRMTCFTCIRFDQVEDKFLDYSGLHPTELAYITVDDKKALRIIAPLPDPTIVVEPLPGEPRDTVGPPRISYFIPNAVDNYHIQIFGPAKKAAEMDAFVSTIELGQ